MKKIEWETKSMDLKREGGRCVELWSNKVGRKGDRVGERSPKCGGAAVRGKEEK